MIKILEYGREFNPFKVEENDLVAWMIRILNEVIYMVLY